MEIGEKYATQDGEEVELYSCDGNHALGKTDQGEMVSITRTDLLRKIEDW